MGRTSDIAEVRTVIEQYIEGSGSGDAALLRSIFYKDAVMMGAMGEERMLGTPEPFFKMIEDSPPLSESDSEYMAEIVDIRVFGQAAIATLSEENFFGMGFVDSFHLVKIEGEWRITSKVFNRD
ncbi:MAG: hypothetical protein CMQ19_07645 [Gammaproteobacteria bacterium]|jgi:ketosteroid isomerase-like protein|nr:hypothetical protein [Gammaproteobacteria bacterium]|tara:strand:- start:294 stop:665 length:372 start_codon:yes stop_codon:yes gene_type:complete